MSENKGQMRVCTVKCGKRKRYYVRVKEGEGWKSIKRLREEGGRWRE